MDKTVVKIARFNTSSYFDEQSTWQLFPKNNFRSHLLECAIRSGYVAFQHLLFDHFAASLPDKVLYARFNTQFISDNFSAFETSCRTWVKNKLTATSSTSCEPDLPAICLIPTPTSRTEAMQHNLVWEMLQGEVKNFQAVLNTAAEIISRGIPYQMLFEDDLVGATLVECGETLRESKTSLEGQSSPLQQSILLGLQQVRVQVSNLNQQVLVASLQLWNSTTNPGTTGNGSSVYTEELVKLRQEVDTVKLSIADNRAACGTPCPALDSPAPGNITRAFCDRFFDSCKTNIFPFERIVSFKKLLEYSFVNFYLGVSWSVCMFIILVISAIYTCRQHVKVKKLTEQMERERPDKKQIEQQPLIDMNRLGKALSNSGPR